LDHPWHIQNAADAELSVPLLSPKEDHPALCVGHRAVRLEERLRALPTAIETSGLLGLEINSLRQLLKVPQWGIGHLGSSWPTKTSAYPRHHTKTRTGAS